MLDLLQGSPLPGLDPGAVAAAAAQVRSECGWHIAPQLTETITVRPTAAGLVHLPSLQVAAVTAVTSDGLPVWFEHDPPERELRLHNPWPWWHHRVRVTLTHGYAQCPADVRQAVAVLAAGGLVPQPRLLTRRDGPFSASYADDSPAASAGGLMDAYRLPAIG